MGSLNPSKIIREDDTIIGIAYQDGYFRDTSLPVELWKLWTPEQRMLYHKACMYGSLMRFKHDSKRMVQKYHLIWEGLWKVPK